MKKSIAIIGGGAAAMLLAAHLNESKFNITIYERNAALGRKFLVAGDGGFNLTHSEALSPFITRYTPPSFFNTIITSFSSTNLVEWLRKIGIETFIGTSKRIFPSKGIKPIAVLNAILAVLKKKNISLKTNHTWIGWNDHALLFETGKNAEHVTITSDIVVFCLGGASWKVTGSDGTWQTYFAEKGIEINPFQASNCGYEIKWKNEFIESTEGQSLKNISITCSDCIKKGEVVLTKFGIEGGAIYALSPQIRTALNEKKEAVIYIDLKPSLSLPQLKTKFGNRGNTTIKKILIDRLNLDNTSVELLKTILSKEAFLDIDILLANIKKLPLTITAFAPLDEAISTVGGIPLTEIDATFQLTKLPNHYCMGEMLDWDAPTGGYLLQGCFSMGYWVAKKLNEKY